METGKPFTASVAKGEHVYYHEHSRTAKENNRKVRRIPQTKILEALDTLVKQYKLPEDAKDQVRKACIDAYKNDFDVIFSNRKKQNTIIDEQISKKQKMKELYSAGIIDADELSEDFRIIRRCIADAEYELAQCHGSLEVLEKRSDEMVELLNILTGNFRTLTDDQKGTFSKLIMVELLVDHQGGLKIKQKEAFANLFCSDVNLW